MQLYLGMVLVSFAVTMALLVPFIGWLYRKRFVRQTETAQILPGDTLEYKKFAAKHSQKAGTPTGAGVLLVVVTMVLFALTSLGLKDVRYGGYSYWWEVGVLFFTFGAFGLLGLYDDVIKIFGYERTGFFGMRMRQKFIIQWMLGLVSAAVLYFGLGIDFINIPFLGVIRLGWMYFPVAGFLVVWFANAFDITSGLDGLGEGLLLICLLAFWGIAAADLDKVLQLFLAIWIGATAAGIYFTINPARTFQGNSSGMAFGATLAIVGLLSGKILALLIIGGVIVADGASSLIQILSRRIFKRRVFPIAPVHHWLEVIGWEEPKIVARAWLGGIVMAIFGVWLASL